MMPLLKTLYVDEDITAASKGLIVFNNGKISPLTFVY